MKKITAGLLIMLIMVLLTQLTGCKSDQTQVHSTPNPTAEDILSDNPNANIFMYNQTIYNTGIAWVDELELTKDEFITEIIKKSDNGKDYVDGTANKLSVGTKIYSVKERGDILVAETPEGDIRFYYLVEG